MSVIGVILARGGSKGIPGKNLKAIHGMSLIRRAALEAKSSDLDAVYVYSDSPEILKEAELGGAETVVRPKEVSGDLTTSEESIQAFMGDVVIKPHVDIMLIQCTTPFLRHWHINKGISLYLDEDKGLDSVISATSCCRYLGYTSKKVAKGNWVPIYPYRWLRQEQGPLYYMENGGFYLATQNLWRAGRRIGRKCGMVLMSWWESLEIDEPTDLQAARALAPLLLEGDESCHSAQEDKCDTCMQRDPVLRANLLKTLGEKDNP